MLCDTKKKKKATFEHRKAIFFKNVPYLKSVNLFLACERQFSAQLQLLFQDIAIQSEHQTKSENVRQFLTLQKLHRLHHSVISCQSAPLCRNVRPNSAHQPNEDFLLSDKSCLIKPKCMDLNIRQSYHFELLNHCGVIMF